MEYLKRAEDYAQARGDGSWFKNIYTQYRDTDSVADSVWKTLSYLYSDHVANTLKTINAMTH